MAGVKPLIVASGPKKAPVSPLESIFTVLPENIRQLLENIPKAQLGMLEEFRFRYKRPLIMVIEGHDYFLAENGTITLSQDQAYIISNLDLQRLIQLVSGSSIYALEEELRSGYITITGGHRVGICGRVVVEKGKVRTMKHITSLNIRLSREVLGAATKMLPYIIDPHSGLVKHTMLVSPPRCGKTTILRDLIRQLSDGIPVLNFSGVTVGVVDERSEIAGCYYGIPQKDVGMRTDVLDACPKAEGMMMLLRAMSPQVIATDEIGSKEDIQALEEVFNAGIKVITTVHGADLAELIRRPALKYLIELKVIERFIFLGRSCGVGTIEDIIDGQTMQSLGVKI